VENSAGLERHVGHYRREGEAYGDADHGRRWMGAGTVAGLIYIERNEWSGWSDFRWELGEIFF
jgi:hypothetical protein